MLKVDGEVVFVGQYLCYKADQEVCGEVVDHGRGYITIKVTSNGADFEEFEDHASKFWRE